MRPLFFFQIAAMGWVAAFPQALPSAHASCPPEYAQGPRGFFQEVVRRLENAHRALSEPSHPVAVAAPPARWQSTLPRDAQFQRLSQLLEMGGHWQERAWLHAEYGDRVQSDAIAQAGRTHFDSLQQTIEMEVEMIPIEKRGATDGYIFTFPDGSQGFFKPDGPFQPHRGHARELANARSEITVSRVDREYGFGIVPYTRSFTWQSPSGQVMTGSFQYFVAGLKTGAIPSEVNIARPAALALITGNIDYRPANMAVVQPNISPRHALITDNGLAFQADYGPSVFIRNQLIDLFPENTSQGDRLARRVSQEAPDLANWRNFLLQKSGLPAQQIHTLMDEMDRTIRAMVSDPHVLAVLEEFLTPAGRLRYERVTPGLDSARQAEAAESVQRVLEYARHRGWIHP